MIDKESNRVSGGRDGRVSGYEYELEVKDLINEHKKIGLTLIKLKHNKLLDVKDLNNLKATKLPEGKAGDIKIECKNFIVGVDSKKPTGAGFTQWVRKRIHLFLKKATNKEKEIFMDYFAYDKPKDGKRTHTTFTKEEEKIFFDYIDEEKVIMIKERWDKDKTTWCDFLITTSNEDGKRIVKIVFIDDLLKYEIVFNKMKMKKTNYQFGKWITFKPYGSHEPDLQFTISKSVFNSKYGIHVDLKGNIIKKKLIF
jgi:hypothetical protein